MGAGTLSWDAQWPERETVQSYIAPKSGIYGSIALQPLYEGVSKSFRTACLQRELQMVQLSATRCNRIAILWVSLVSFAAITLYVASQRVSVVVYFVIGSVRKLFVTPSYALCCVVLRPRGNIGFFFIFVELISLGISCCWNTDLVRWFHWITERDWCEQ